MAFVKHASIVQTACPIQFSDGSFIKDLLIESHLCQKVNKHRHHGIIMIFGLAIWQHDVSIHGNTTVSFKVYHDTMCYQ